MLKIQNKCQPISFYFYDPYGFIRVGECVFVYVCASAQLLQLCPILWDGIDCSLPGSSVHGIFQAIILEWVAIPFSRGSSQPRDQTHISHICCTEGRFFYH